SQQYLRQLQSGSLFESGHAADLRSGLLHRHRDMHLQHRPGGKGSWHGLNRVGLAAYHQSPLAVGPRLGFAYDLLGDGTTAIRGGAGLFYNRLDGNQYYGLSGQAPITYQQTVNNLNFSQIAAVDGGQAPSLSSLSIAPIAPTAYPANVPWDKVINA